MTAERLARQMAGYVRTPAPAGTPAEAYLAAVLAERTRRASAAGPAHSWTPAPHQAAPPGPPIHPGQPLPEPPFAGRPTPPAPPAPPTGFALPE